MAASKVSLLFVLSFTLLSINDVLSNTTRKPTLRVGSAYKSHATKEIDFFCVFAPLTDGDQYANGAFVRVNKTDEEKFNERYSAVTTSQHIREVIGVRAQGQLDNEIGGYLLSHVSSEDRLLGDFRCEAHIIMTSGELVIEKSAIFKMTTVIRLTREVLLNLIHNQNNFLLTIMTHMKAKEKRDTKYLMEKTKETAETLRQFTIRTKDTVSDLSDSIASITSAVQDLSLFVRQDLCANLNTAGFVTIMRRFSDSVDFDRTYQDYKYSFGNRNGNYWIGLETMHHLTSSCGVSTGLIITMHNYNKTRVEVRYTNFTVGHSNSGYKLKVNGYECKHCNGTDLNALMTDHNDMMFSTKDNDQDKNMNKSCAAERTGGWWYNDCHGGVHLTGLNHPDPNKHGSAITYEGYGSHNKSIRFVQMIVVTYMPEAEINYSQ